MRRLLGFKGTEVRRRCCVLRTRFAMVIRPLLGPVFAWLSCLRWPRVGPALTWLSSVADWGLLISLEDVVVGEVGSFGSNCVRSMLRGAVPVTFSPSEMASDMLLRCIVVYSGAMDLDFCVRTTIWCEDSRLAKISQS